MNKEYYNSDGNYPTTKSTMFDGLLDIIFISLDHIVEYIMIFF